MPSEIACLSRRFLSGSLASWNSHCCTSSPSTLITLTPGVALSVWTMSGGTRSMTWNSPALSPAARVEISGTKRKVTFSTFGTPGFQYSGLAVRSAFSPRVHPASLNGPVPIGF